MRLTTKRHFYWHTTPDELRRIADQLDAQWDQSHCGAEVPKREIIDHDCVLEIIINQETMPRSFGAKLRNAG